MSSTSDLDRTEDVTESDDMEFEPPEDDSDMNEEGEEDEEDEEDEEQEDDGEVNIAFLQRLLESGRGT